MQGGNIDEMMANSSVSDNSSDDEINSIDLRKFDKFNKIMPRQSD